MMLLQVLAGMYDGGGGGGGGGGENIQVPQNQVNWNRRSWLIEPDKVGAL